MCLFVCGFVCLFVRDNLENGWMDFDIFVFEHYGPRLRHGHHRLLKNGLKTTEKWVKIAVLAVT